MHRTRSTSKRSASPAIIPDNPPKTPPVPQIDGSCFGKPEMAEEVTTQAALTVPPKMPSFLHLTDLELHDKYAEITRLENERLAASKKPDSDGRWARLDPDPVLDRYNNIHPWANRRVVLKVPKGVNDYINASPVELTSTSGRQSTLKSGTQDKFICMQGPKRQTVDHVWHMIWHELALPYNSSPAVIIMLSPTHQQLPDDPNRLFEKCFPYYPTDENSEPLYINEKNGLGENFKATVKFVSREPAIEGTAIEVRRLVMTVEGQDEEKPIWHYLYPNWPDYGALEEENVASILALMEITREQNGKGENPRVVHCSAGVGRTGTFIALEFLVGELQSGAWEHWDEGEDGGTDPIFTTVNQLREQRKTMVQSYEQYAFLYEVCRKIWEEKYATTCTAGKHQHSIAPEICAKTDVGAAAE